ncbi:hypothetical protein LP419_07975 [Massilia sp. H-1]|nr:hypothetical protein LP419_07975 [Massilia sp. H-1]
MSSSAIAANYTLWINGRTGGGVVGDYASFTYWGPASTAADVNKKSVNWDGYNSIASQNDKISQCARLLLHRQQLVLCRHPQRGRPDARLHAGQLRRLEPPQEKRGG